MSMSFLRRLFAPTDPRDALRPLYARIVAEARQPGWYASGGVPDTLDGRFEMVALILSLVLHRLDEDTDRAHDAVLLTEVFVDDMDAQMRQIGFGDMVVGKQVGRIMSAVGGRLGAYATRDAASLRAALVRNLYREADPGDAALDWTLARIAALRAMLDARETGTLLIGEPWEQATPA